MDSEEIETMCQEIFKDYCNGNLRLWQAIERAFYAGYDAGYTKGYAEGFIDSEEK